MNGAESAIRTAVGAGVEVCFANPGTTEMQFVAALDRVEGMRAVLGLFEGVATGAADGYARMAGRPALTLLHLGPGFANGIANLHNARRACSPVINLIGDHASWHAEADAPLSSDIASLAHPVSRWVRASRSAAGLGRDMAEAIAAARSAPGGVASLIVGADHAWEEGGATAASIASIAPARVDAARIEDAARALRGAREPVLLIGGAALGERALRAAARCGARVLVETFPARLERGADLPALEKLPYFPEQVVELLAPVDVLVVAGARTPVSFFGYPDQPSRLVPDTCELHKLVYADEDPTEALLGLADAVGGPSPAAGARPAPEVPKAALSVGSLGAALAALQPEGAIVMEEANTSALAWWAFASNAPRHSVLSLTGGAIGQGPPCATGAALACPDRTVIDFQADGSGLYTLQALWTQAREGLEVKTVICANRAYRILQVELARAGISEPGPAARALTDLTGPELDWVSLARGMGVPGERVDTLDAFVDAFGRALATPGPYLLEVLL
jgi:acetolactate synthase-1/2/3 large subunit